MSAFQADIVLKIPVEDQKSVQTHADEEASSDVTLKYSTFAIQDHEKNKSTNPMREVTNLIPIYVRRVESVELMPKPFRTTTQLFVCSLLSLLCCICIGGFALKYATEAKILRNKGLHSAASKHAKMSRRWIIAAFIGGIAIAVLCLLIIFLK